MAPPTDPTRNPPGSSAPAGPGLADIPPSAEAPQAYRPLSLLAIAGLLVSAAFALVVIAGGAIAFANNSPWLLPVWVLVLPVVGGALAWAARSRINASEGTLGGAALAGWGVGLSVGFGVTYLAYYAATYFAVTQQARAFADTWLDDLKQGKVLEAYLLTTPPPRPAQDAALREKIEMLVNPSAMPLGRFEQADFVRMLERGGAATRVEPAGVVSWEWDKGGYLVKLRYRLHTPMLSFDLEVTLFGKESPTGDWSGRQWYVSMGGTHSEEGGFTPEGDRLQTAVMEARSVGQAWAEKLMQRDLRDAYFLTLFPAERKRQEEAAKKCRLAPLAAAGPAALLAQDPACRDFLAGEAAFLNGSLVRADTKKFWAREKVRAEVLRELPKLFSPEFRGAVQVIFNKQARMPAWDEEGGKLRLAFDVEIPLLDPGAGGGRPTPRFVVEARLVLESQTPLADTSRRSWHVQRLELVRASVPDTPRRPAPPPPPPQQ